MVHQSVAKQSKIKDLLWGLLTAALVLLVLEGFARIAHTIISNLNDSKEPEWYVYSPDMGWEPKPNFKGSVYGVYREFDSDGYLSVDAPRNLDKDKVKVLFLGDSNTFGVTAPTESTFAQQLEKLMPNVTSINLGVPGYTSFQGYRRFLNQGLKVQPDIVVISFNFNDRRYVLRQEDVDALSFQARTRHERLTYITDSLRASYLYRTIHLMFKKLNIGRNIENETVRLDKLPSRVDPASYRENLVRMVEVARSRNIRVMFLLLKDNPVQTHYLTSAIELLDKSQFRTAAEYLKVTDYSQPWFSSLARLYMAKIYRLQGRTEEADTLLTVTPTRSLHGGSPIYLDKEYNEIMKDVAQEYEVAVVDAARALEKSPSDYVDFCHFNTEGHRKIAHLLHARLEKLLSTKQGK
jgi:lysophospholipase L1-like esterase